MSDPRGGSRAVLVLTLALFLICATLWSLAVPPWETPDEPGHARYVDFLVRERRLPVAGEEAPGEAHQPPLYYALAASVAVAAGLPPMDPTPRRNPGFRWYGGLSDNKYLHDEAETPPLAGSARSLHRLRLLSVLMGGVTVWLVYVIAAAAGRSPVEAALLAAVAAFIPQFTFVSGSLNNDNLANMLSAASLACMAAGVAGSARPALWPAAGALAGLAMLAKFTCLALLPCGLIAILLSGRRTPARPGRTAAAFLGAALVLAAPLLARNLLSLGDPLGLAAQTGTLPNLLDRKTLLSSYFVTEFPRVLFRSFWGTFGWMSLPMPAALYFLAAAAMLAAAIGLAIMRRDAAERRIQILMGAAIAAQLAQVVWYNLTFTQAQGRFLFPVLAPIALLLGAGLAETGRRLRLPSPRPIAALLIVAALAVLNLGVLRLVVVPAYQTAARLP